jgi:hypothetical protein
VPNYTKFFMSVASLLMCVQSIPSSAIGYQKFDAELHRRIAEVNRNISDDVKQVNRAQYAMILENNSLEPLDLPYATDHAELHRRIAEVNRNISDDVKQVYCVQYASILEDHVLQSLEVLFSKVPRNSELFIDSIRPDIANSNYMHNLTALIIRAEQLMEESIQLNASKVRTDMDAWRAISESRVAVSSRLRGLMLQFERFAQLGMIHISTWNALEQQLLSHRCADVMISNRMQNARKLLNAGVKQVMYVRSFASLTSAKLSKLLDFHFIQQFDQYRRAQSEQVRAELNAQKESLELSLRLLNFHGEVLMHTTIAPVASNRISEAVTKYREFVRPLRLLKAERQVVRQFRDQLLDFQSAPRESVDLVAGAIDQYEVWIDGSEKNLLLGWKPILAAQLKRSKSRAADVAKVSDRECREAVERHIEFSTSVSNLEQFRMAEGLYRRQVDLCVERGGN